MLRLLARVSRREVSSFRRFSLVRALIRVRLQPMLRHGRDRGHRGGARPRPFPAPLLLASLALLAAALSSDARACSCKYDQGRVLWPPSGAQHPVALPWLVRGDEVPLIETSAGDFVELEAERSIEPHGLCAQRIAFFSAPISVGTGWRQVRPGVARPGGVLYPAERGADVLVVDAEPELSPATLTLIVRNDPYVSFEPEGGSWGSSCGDSRLWGRWYTQAIEVLLSTDTLAPLLLRVSWEDDIVGTLEEARFLRDEDPPPGEGALAALGLVSVFLTPRDTPCLDIEVLDARAEAVVRDRICMHPERAPVTERYPVSVALAGAGIGAEVSVAGGCACRVGGAVRSGLPGGPAALALAAIAAAALARRRRR